MAAYGNTGGMAAPGTPPAAPAGPPRPKRPKTPKAPKKAKGKAKPKAPARPPRGDRVDPALDRLLESMANLRFGAEQGQLGVNIRTGGAHHQTIDKAFQGYQGAMTAADTQRQAQEGAARAAMADMATRATGTLSGLSQGQQAEAQKQQSLYGLQSAGAGQQAAQAAGVAGMGVQAQGGALEALFAAARNRTADNRAAGELGRITAHGETERYVRGERDKLGQLKAKRGDFKTATAAQLRSEAAKNAIALETIQGRNADSQRDFLAEMLGIKAKERTAAQGNKTKLTAAQIAAKAKRDAAKTAADAKRDTAGAGGSGKKGGLSPSQQSQWNQTYSKVTGDVAWLDSQVRSGRFPTYTAAANSPEGRRRRINPSVTTFANARNRHAHGGPGVPRSVLNSVGALFPGAYLPGWMQRAAR